jgi:hypothetical protein
MLLWEEVSLSTNNWQSCLRQSDETLVGFTCILVLVFIEQEILFKQINLDLPWNHEANRLHFQKPIFTYVSPAVSEQATSDGDALSHFAGNMYVFGTDKALRLNQEDFPDGTSNTLMAGQALGNFKPWGHTTNWRDPGLGINTTADGFGNPNTNQKYVLFLLADGSVRTINENVKSEFLKAMAMPAGRQRIPDNWDEP